MRPLRKCDPECEWPAWKCWWDMCWFHCTFCMGYGRLFKWPGPLYWICPDCRALVNDERREAREEGKPARW